MVGGSKFFDRMEVKDILAYLILLINPNYTPAFARVINVPKRGVGEKTLAEFIALAAEQNLSPMEFAEQVAKSTAKKGVPGVRPMMKTAVGKLVGAVKELRKAAAKGADVGQLIEMILDNVEYKAHLQKEADFDARIQNVEELVNFSKTAVAAARGIASLRDLPVPGQGSDYDSADDGAAIEVANPTSRGVVASASSRGEQSSLMEGINRFDDDDFDASAELEDVKSAVKRERESSTSKSSRSQSKGKQDDEAWLVSDSDEEQARPKKAAKTKKGKAIAASSSTSNLAKRASRQQEESDTDDDAEVEVPEDSPLRVFLEACTLSTDTEAASSTRQEDQKPKVTLSTCHAAKGLEYPIVFVVGVEDDCFPFFRCTKPHEIEEERRLLYVAMTRAQSLLYLTHCQERMVMGQFVRKDLSTFLRSLVGRDRGGKWKQGEPKVGFGKERPEIDEKALQAMADILERTAPDPEDVKRSKKAFEKSAAADMMDQPEPSSSVMYGMYDTLGESFGTGFGRAFGGGGFAFGGAGAVFDGTSSYARAEPEPPGDASGSGGASSRFTELPDDKPAAGFTTASQALSRLSSGSDIGKHRNLHTSTMQRPSRPPGAPLPALGARAGSAPSYSSSRLREDGFVELSHSIPRPPPREEGFVELAHNFSKSRPVAPAPRYLDEYKLRDKPPQNSTEAYRTGSDLLGGFQAASSSSWSNLKDILPASDGSQSSSGSQGGGGSRIGSSKSLGMRRSVAKN